MNVQKYNTSSTLQRNYILTAWINAPDRMTSTNAILQTFHKMSYGNGIRRDNGIERDEFIASR